MQYIFSTDSSAASLQQWD